MAYVHYSMLDKKFSRSYRKALASFIHRVKKIIGGHYHKHVNFDCNSGKLIIEVNECVEEQDSAANLYEEICDLAEAYGILDNVKLKKPFVDNIEGVADEEVKQMIVINLYKTH